MKLIRVTLAVCALLILIAIVAAGSLMVLMDPNKLKPVIIAEVMKKTGYELFIEGNLSWSFYPRISVKIEKMSLKTAAEPNPFVNLYHVAIAADLLELLKGKQALAGDIYIDQIQFMQVKAQNAHMRLHWQGQNLLLEPFTADFYQGSMQGVLQGMHLSETPAWSWNIQLKNIQLQPLLQDLNGGQTKLSVAGLGEVQLQASTMGMDRRQALANLNGTSTFNIKQGELQGIDLNYFVKTADAFINGKSLEEVPHTSRTVFDSFTGSAVIKNGVADTENLLLNSPAFVAKASGVLDLTTKMLDYQLQILPMTSQQIHWAVPLLISGDLHHPSIHLDKLKLETMIAREQLEEVKNKVHDEMKELPAKADKFFKKLLGK